MATRHYSLFLVLSVLVLSGCTEPQTLPNTRNDATPSEPVQAAEGTRIERGRLEPGDARLTAGEYVDNYTFYGNQGEQIVLDLRTNDFDPYLTVSTPDGRNFENDDYFDDVSRSLLTFTLREEGSYEVSVTSYSAEETGEYALTLGVPGEVKGANDYIGELTDGDDTLEDGAFFDTYEVTGVPGRRLTLDLTSDDFDTYLVLVSPSGTMEDNDDVGDFVGHSAIETDLSQPGTYLVGVSSYEAGETGNYRLLIDVTDVRTPEEEYSLDLIDLANGEPAIGRLGSGLSRLQGNKYQDLYAFTGTDGSNVRVELSSAEFDTYLIVILPSGGIIDNDDFLEDTGRSVVDMTLTESGRYQVIATSYGEREIGDYQITANISPGALTIPQTAPTQDSTASVFGVFTGISDYSALGYDNLSFTAEDAVVTRDALINSGMMNPTNAVTLIDGAATIENVRRAISDLSSRIGPDDVFVFFFSGHGGQVPRSDGPNAADADGYDESIVLYDGEIIDDELGSLLDQISGAASLVILDSCFSGGFAKDIVSRPGRMGLFSSEEDVLSLVAAKFRAGGYLSHFFAEAVDGGRADTDGDNNINAVELSQYLYERYEEEAQRKGESFFSPPNFGYQHLVADRGGIPHDAVLFQLR